MAETFSVWEYIVALFAGWGVFAIGAIGVIVVALVSNLFKKKNETGQNIHS